MMVNGLFVSMLGAFLLLLLTWGFRTLPQEQWQIMATVPRKKDRWGQWVGVNITYYGLLTASAGTLAILTFVMLMAAVGVPCHASLTVAGVVLACCLPAAKLVARVVERKQHTSSVAGAAFIGIVISPLVVWLVNASQRAGAARSPLVPSIAAMAIAYVLGEGFGRLACISFGCCYGKPITEVGWPVRRLFEKFHFAFRGETKKIAYAADLENIKVVPIQALTSLLYVAAALTGMLLFLQSHFRTAFVLTMVLSHGWRIYSETLRADERGGGRISVYQVMAMIALLYAVTAAVCLPEGRTPLADLAAGLSALWDPAVIIVLQAFWAVMFLYTGWSMVTGSVLSFHVHRDRI